VRQIQEHAMPGWPIKFSAAWSYVPQSQRTSLAGIGRGAASVGYFRPGRTERPAQVGQIGAKAWGQGSVPAARDRQRVMRKAGSAAFASAPATIFPRRRGAWTRATAKDACISVSSVLQNMHKVA
jgi:hypothetical protein